MIRVDKRSKSRTSNTRAYCNSGPPEAQWPLEVSKPSPGRPARD